MRPDLYTRLYLWLSARRWRVLGLTVLITVAGMIISSRIDLEEDVLAVLPEHDQTVADYKYAVRKFKQIDRVYFDVGIDTNDADRLAGAADELDGLLATNPVFSRIMYRVEMHGQDKVVGFLTGALPNLFTAADASLLAPKLETNSIREYLTVMRRKLGGMEGMVLKNVVAADPIGMSALMVNKVLPLQNGFGGTQLVDGRITSGDGRHVLLMAEPDFPSSNTKGSTELVAQMLLYARTVEKDFPGTHVAITGGHRMTVDNAALIKSDATRCIFLGMGAMLVLCVTAYRRRWLAVVTFLPSLFGTLIAGVALFFLWRHLSAIATGFATIAIGITVDYAIYVVYQLDNAAGLDRAGVGRHVGRLVLPITVGALTTIAAFVVMAGSPMHGYQQLGVFGAVGVLFSAAFALIILPLLVPIPKQGGQPALWLTRLFEKFHLKQTRWRKWLLLGVVLLTIVTAFGARRLRFEGDIARLNGITEATRLDDALINKTWGDALNMTLIVARGTNAAEALAQNDRVAEVLANTPGVQAVSTLAAVCPAPAAQAANIQRWHEFWTVERCDTLRQNLAKIGGDLGFRPDAFAVFWQRLATNPPTLTLDLFRGTPLQQAFSERTALTPGDNAISTLFKISDRSQIEKLQQALSGMIVLNKKNFADHIAGLAKAGLTRFALWTGILVAAIVFFSLGSIELVVATLLPLVFSLLWTFGTMGWLGLPIDMMNSVFVIFIIGIGEDYSVFLATSRLDEWHGRPQRIAATSASVLISALTTIFGFAVLVFARHPVLFSMGTTVLLGMVFAFAATMILTPLFMDLLLYKNPPQGAPRWWHPLGTLWVLIQLAVSQIILYGFLRPLLQVFSPRRAADQLRRATRWFARGIIQWMPFGRLKYQNITPEVFQRPCVIISNHQSAVDVVVIVGLPGDIRQTAKKRVFDSPVLGIGCKLLGHVMVESQHPEVTLERCRERLAAGASVHFYPEGTRSHDGFLLRFHRGAFELAIELRQDILPVVLCDTRTAMPRDAYWFEPYQASVRAWPRITPENFDYARGVVPLMRHCEAIVRAALQQQLDELNTPRIVRRKVERLYRYQGKFVEQFVHWKMKLDPMFASLDAVVPRTGFILDLGCGYGVVTHWLAAYTDGRTFCGVDYDDDKIRVARRAAPESQRLHFEVQNILEWEYPPCDAVLLLDVLHYWSPEKQQLILCKARQALRPGGKLILREAARAENEAHRRVDFWEKIATRLGHNKTEEGLQFQTLAQLEAMLEKAGFAPATIKRDAGRDSNVLLVTVV